MCPIAPNPNSGTAEPIEPTRNMIAATMSPPRRPRDVEIQAASKPPMKQPTRALEMVQPDRLLRAVSVSASGLMK